MSKPRKAMKYFAVGMSVGLLIGLAALGLGWYLEGESNLIVLSRTAGGSLFLLTGAVYFGWMTVFLLTLRRFDAAVYREWHSVDKDVNDLSRRTHELFAQLAREFDAQLVVIRGEIEQIQKLLADAIEKLLGSFTGMEAGTRRQQDIALRLAARGGGEGMGGLETFSTRHPRRFRDSSRRSWKTSMKASCWRNAWRLSAPTWARSSGCWTRSKASPGRPTCWRSMPRSRRRARATRGGVSPWWRTKCARCRRVPASSAPKSAASWTPSGNRSWMPRARSANWLPQT